MCNLCFPGGVEVGTIAPGYTLIHYQGGYRILAGHGHGVDDILWHFIHDPEPDPDPRCETDDTGWLDRATEACTLDGRLLPMSAEDGYHFISACVQAGYDRWTHDLDLHRLFSLWLFDRCGKLIHSRGTGS